MLCVLMKILSHASAKKKTKRLKGFEFRTVISFSSDIMAEKRLTERKIAAKHMVVVFFVCKRELPHIQ